MKSRTIGLVLMIIMLAFCMVLVGCEEEKEETYIPTVTSIAELTDFLDSTTGGTYSNPIKVKVNINLETDWEELVAAVSEVKKSVALDLSGSTGSTITGSDSLVSIYVRSVILPNTITSIGEYAFRNLFFLSSITIPDSVTSIGAYAFYGCFSLTSITIPYGVPSIGTYTFFLCSGLTSITIPSSVTSIGINAFSSCSSLTSVTFQGIINSANFSSVPFPGDLRTKYLAGGIGTYTRPDGSSETWTKQP